MQTASNVPTLAELKARETRLRDRCEYMHHAILWFVETSDYEALKRWAPLAERAVAEHESALADIVTAIETSRAVAEHESALADIVTAIETSRNVSLPPVTESRA